MSAATSVQRAPAVVAMLLLASTTVAPTTVFAQRAQPRGGGSSGAGAPSGRGDSGGERSGGRTTAPREGPRTAPRQATPKETARESPRTAERSAEPSSGDASSSDSAPRTTAARRARGDNPTVGYAVDRRGPPPSTWDDHDHGYYPYWPGYGYGGFYPWGYGGFGLGYYGPWYGGYGYGYGYGYGSSYYGLTDEGSLRLKVKPREASVFVDGYFVGRVDDFDGVFQKLHLDPGPHRIEVRADGYEPLNFEVRILPDRKITYEETLKPQR